MVHTSFYERRLKRCAAATPTIDACNPSFRHPLTTVLPLLEPELPLLLSKALELTTVPVLSTLELLETAKVAELLITAFNRRGRAATPAAAALFSDVLRKIDAEDGCND